MSLSLKTIASNCLSLSPPFSVLRDFLGHTLGYIPQGVTISLKRQLQLVKGHSLGMNIILVGVENFTTTDLEETESDIQFTRDIYANVDLGIRKIEWYQISAADAGGYATIDSSAEAHDLTDDWSVPNNFVDVYIVRVMTHADGVSAVEGPCSKEDKDEMTGSVVSLNGAWCNSGNTLAHEVGHYLGASKDDPGHHSSDPSNFITSASNCNTKIEAAQGTDMKKHCYVKDVC